jgi:hypothetical protein
MCFGGAAECTGQGVNGVESHFHGGSI